MESISSNDWIQTTHPHRRRCCSVSACRQYIRKQGTIYNKTNRNPKIWIYTKSENQNIGHTWFHPIIPDNVSEDTIRINNLPKNEY